MKFYIYALFTLLAMTACSSTRQVSGEFAFYDFNIIHEGTGAAGTQLLRVWGKGQTKKQAFDNIRSHAVATILFDGIKDGNDHCSRTPLLSGSNQQERNGVFFATFFRERKYLDFSKIVTVITEAHGKSIKSWCAIVEIDRIALLNFLKENNIE